MPNGAVIDDPVTGAVMYSAMLAVSKEAAVGKEHERRFKLKSLPKGVGKGSVIQQGMMIEGKDSYARIRRQGKKYTMTAKYFPLAHEAEVEISKEIFDALWPKVFKPQTKTRYKVRTKDNNDWIIDQFEDGSVVAEVETPRKGGKIDMPKKLEGAKEITHAKAAKFTDEHITYEHVDTIPGGKADKKKPEDFPAKAMAKGTEHELEHTNKKHQAHEIAMDHLVERLDYYDKLEKMEKGGEDLKSRLSIKPNKKAAKGPEM